ncbi:mothers against decapentaplegic homolog 6-like [Sycon ciliatum]|uniref:Mothers against decapentaplegic homolog n=1 Tax=Sycon ciliatum TaxID=27933 RepID=A0A077SMW3_9METZ|nr:Smad 6/7B SciSmad6/7B [Sycon ciliatum]|eukprot:scpid46437/ scgid18141/ Mothers against decapentaplegic homolog 6; SMAD family member 6
MLSSKKSLIKKLWKSSSVASHAEGDSMLELLKVICKQSEAKELKSFGLAQEDDAGACWMLPTNTVSVNVVVSGEQHLLNVTPEAVCCKVFRWPDLDLSAEDVIRRLPICPDATSSGKRCCNPFHFGKLLHFRSTPLDRISLQHCSSTTELGKTSDSVSCDSAFDETTVSSSAGRQHTIVRRHFAADGTTGSEESGMEGSSGASLAYEACCPDLDAGEHEKPVSPARRRERPATESWLTMAYWEGRERMGRQRTCKSSAMHVYHEGSAQLDGSFNIGSIKSRCRSAAAEKRRQQIGSGFFMWRTHDNQKVCLYNGSKHSMYVQSPTLACSQLDGEDKLVKAIPSGHIVEIFDWQRAVQLEDYLRSRRQLTFPFDVMAVRVSMVSGWGYGHRRPTVMQCPCWIEAFFEPESD